MYGQSACNPAASKLTSAGLDDADLLFRFGDTTGWEHVSETLGVISLGQAYQCHRKSNIIYRYPRKAGSVNFSYPLWEDPDDEFRVVNMSGGTSCSLLHCYCHMGLLQRKLVLTSCPFCMRVPLKMRHYLMPSLSGLHLSALWLKVPVWRSLSSLLVDFTGILAMSNQNDLAIRLGKARKMLLYACLDVHLVC